MAYALSNTTPVAHRILGKLNEIAAAWQAACIHNTVYNRTYNELNALSDRDLADIGVDRGDIEAIAQQEAAKAL